jgi:predicted Fe-Mo cluster-binding NifX family protein
MAPVELLRDNGVQAIVVGGMGARPLAGFNQVGIDVYFAAQESFSNVEDVVNGIRAGKLVLMQPGQACQGGSDCQGH